MNSSVLNSSVCKLIIERFCYVSTRGHSFRANLKGCLDRFRERSTFQTFLHHCDNHKSERNYANYFYCFFSLIHELGVKLRSSETRVLGGFHGLIFVVAAFSFNHE